ncbi:MAG: hypothetical protein P1U86_17135 [Verrucomicrobiales bacterium]|nr:hypothetical protein [Verrucomicrobiales bacterium]
MIHHLYKLCADVAGSFCVAPRIDSGVGKAVETLRFIGVLDRATVARFETDPRNLPVSFEGRLRAEAGI